MSSPLRSWLSRRESPTKHTVAEASRSKSPLRLAMLQLEERLNPSGPTFDYKFTEAAIGSIVTVYGGHGTGSRDRRRESPRCVRPVRDCHGQQPTRSGRGSFRSGLLERPGDSGTRMASDFYSQPRAEHG